MHAGYFIVILSVISAKHPVSVIMLYTALTVTGIVSFFKLEINMFPDICIPAAYVVTECSSLSAEDMEKMVTIPVENSLSSVSGIKRISSVSREGFSSVRLSFGWKVNMEPASAELMEKIDAVYPVLPLEAGKPRLLFTDLSEDSFLTLSAVPAPGRKGSDISRIIEKDFKSRLISIDGVSGVRISGLAEDEIKIDVDYPVLVNAGISLNDVVEAVSSSVFSRPAGKIYKGDKEYRLRAETDVGNISDIGKIPLPGREGLYISDVADIYKGEKERLSYFHSGGKECIGIEIIKTGSSGLLNTAERVKSGLEELNTVFRNDFSVSIIDDSSIELKKTFNSLIFAVITGSAAALSVLALFFRNIRSSLTVIASLPFSLAIVFIYMYFSKLSLNLISITGIIIGIGMVFDNTIIVVDKLISERPLNTDAAAAAVSETALSVTGSTFTTVIIFLPLVFISGISGRLFRDLSSAVIAFITASAIVSVTVPPAFYMLFKMNMSESEKTSFIVSNIKSVYKKYLSCGRKEISYLILLFTLPLSLICFVEKEIIPPGYGKNVTVFAEYVPGYSSEYYSEKSLMLEKNLLESGIAAEVFVRGGIDRDSPEDISSGSNDINTAFYNVSGSVSIKKDSSKYKEVVEKFVSDSMDSYSLKNSEVERDDSFLDRITGDLNSLKCILTFSDREKGEAVFSELASELKEAECLKSMSGNFKRDNPEYKLSFNKEGFASASLTPFDAGRLLYNSVRGIEAASLDTGGETDTDILVRYKNIYTDSPEKISSLRIPLKEGVFDPSAFTEIEFIKNYRTLTRMNRKSCFFFNIVPAPGMSDKTLSVLDRYISRGLELPSVKEMEESTEEISRLFLSAFILIYFFLGAQFESFIIPLFLMLSIPFSVSGSFLILFLSGQSLNISSFLGILILTGTTVNTAIMIFADRNCCSIKKAAEKRLVPASASILTTAAALLPAAFQVNNPLQSSSAAVLIGGLFSGGISVLLIYPFLFQIRNSRISIYKKLKNNDFS